MVKFNISNKEDIKTIMEYLEDQLQKKVVSQAPEGYQGYGELVVEINIEHVL